MGFKKYLCVLSSLAITVSCAATVSADRTASGIKGYILADGDAGYSSSFDINRDGTADVLDLCRYKNALLEGKSLSSVPPLLMIGEVTADYDERLIYVPVMIAENSYGVSTSTTYLSYDTDYFSFSELRMGEFAGDFKFSVSTSKVTYINSYKADLSGGGVLYFYVLKMDNFVPDGNYSFSLRNVTASSAGDKVLNDEQCPVSSPVVSTGLTPSSGNVIKDNMDGHYSDYPGLDEDTVHDRLMRFKDIYPDGTPWTNDNSYTWKGNNTIGFGCVSFAFILSDDVFGSLPARKHTDMTKIKTGDIIRVENDTHSAVVTKVTPNGVILAEGNVNGQVLWGRKYLWEDLQTKLNYVLTRYPE